MDKTKVNRCDDCGKRLFVSCRNCKSLHDRLAHIERKVRELADELREEIDTHNRMRSFQEYEGGRIDKAISVEERLRAIIDAPDAGGEG